METRESLAVRTVEAKLSKLLFIAASCLLIALVPFGNTQAVLIPIPDPMVFATFTDGQNSFDPSTGAFSLSRPIIGVQFPGLILSTIDPLVTSNSVQSITGTFSRPDLADTSGVFHNTTSTITVSDTIVYSTFSSEMKFFQSYVNENFLILDWLASGADSKFVGSNFIASPFLDLLAADAPTIAFVYDTASGKLVGVAADGTGSGGVQGPEPSTGLLLGTGLVALAYARMKLTPTLVHFRRKKFLSLLS